MEPGQIAIIVYAVLMALGGYLGFKLGKSKASLISGGASAALLLVAFGLSLSDPTSGYWMAAGLAAVLGLVFFLRWRKTKKIMPSVGLLLISVAAAVVFVLAATGVLDSPPPTTP